MRRRAEEHAEEVRRFTDGIARNAGGERPSDTAPRQDEELKGTLRALTLGRFASMRSGGSDPTDEGSR